MNSHLFVMPHRNGTIARFARVAALNSARKRSRCHSACRTGIAGCAHDDDSRLRRSLVFREEDPVRSRGAWPDMQQLGVTPNSSRRRAPNPPAGAESRGRTRPWTARGDRRYFGIFRRVGRWFGGIVRKKRPLCLPLGPNTAIYRRWNGTKEIETTHREVPVARFLFGLSMFCLECER